MDLPVYALTAAAAFGLVCVRRENLRLGRREYQMSVQPVLVELNRSSSDDAESVRFGAPRHNSLQLCTSEIYYEEDELLLQVSIPFQNTGTGAAVITHVATEPRAMGSVVSSRPIVRVGERARVNASLLVNSFGPTGGLDVDHFTLNIEYTDAEGNQPMVSRAHIHRFVGARPFVGPIEVLRRGENEPLIVSKLIDAI